MVTEAEYNGGSQVTSSSMTFDFDQGTLLVVTGNVAAVAISLSAANRFRPGKRVTIVNNSAHSVLVFDQSTTTLIETLTSNQVGRVTLIDNSTEDGEWSVRTIGTIGTARTATTGGTVTFATATEAEGIIENCTVGSPCEVVRANGNVPLDGTNGE